MPNCHSNPWCCCYLNSLLIELLVPSENGWVSDQVQYPGASPQLMNRVLVNTVRVKRNYLNLESSN